MNDDDDGSNACKRWQTNLLLSNPWVPQHTDTLTDHRYSEFMVLLKVINDILECRIVLELKAVPECPFGLSVLGLRRCDGFGESEEWQS